ncbi:arginine repressor [Micractinium conductrix]|uniref:Arginine repressor n=1 Tax=Micractinium conductrix TaxID=554055 RepID=A0A2P6VP76_9CHLO|nr:arginine repressor [Micractinium conductrix]|eukprot:PSC75904.1 arginine repressor [Micractinium conductrix]
MFWRRTALRLAFERRLSVRVERVREAVKPLPEQGPLLHYLEVDPAAAARVAPSATLLPLGAYFASLRPHGVVSWERLLVSVADRHGLTAALPLALFLPNAWRKEAGAGGLLASFPSLAVGTAVRRRDAAAAATRGGGSGGDGADGGSAADRAAAHLQAERGPLDLLRAGGVAAAAGGARPLAQAAAAAAGAAPVLLGGDALLGLLGLSAAEAADPRPAPVPEPKLLSPDLLPDLYLGNGGLLLSRSPAGAATCRLMAEVDNRLAANALPGLSQAAIGLLPNGALDGSQPAFSVCLTEGGPELDSIEALVAALADAGHRVRLRLTSNLTSFGVGMSVPLAYPLRCSGMWAGNDVLGKPRDVATLMSHASLLLSVEGPQLDFSLEWCLGVAGFTGWLPYVPVTRAWAVGEAVQCRHAISSGGSAATRVLEAPHPAALRLLRLTTAATCVLNAVGQRDRLLFGGYGYLGVCLDSAAALQQATTGRCTLFPLLLGGEAKASLMDAYRQASSKGRQQQEQQWEYASEAAALQAALGTLPCDTQQEPRTAADAARRALACLPEDSPFAALAECRRGLRAALAAAGELMSGPVHARDLVGDDTSTARFPGVDLRATAGPGEYVVDLKAQPAPGATQTEHAEARREGVERPGGGTYSLAAHVDHKAVKGVLPSAAGAGGFGALSHDHPREGGAYRLAEHVDHRPAKAVMPAVAGMGAMGARQLEERGKGPE